MRGTPTGRAPASSRLAPRSRAMPTGGRRSKPSARFLATGDTQFRRAGRDGAGLKTGVPYFVAV